MRGTCERAPRAAATGENLAGYSGDTLKKRLKSISVKTGDPPVERTERTVLGPSTTRPGVWGAANGPANISVHRRAILVVNGYPFVSQRFAFDRVLVNDEQNRNGDEGKYASYFDYGADIIAVADGVVAAVKDDLSDNVPPQAPKVKINLDTVGGNYMALRIAPNRYAMYVHLQSGRVKVRPG